MGPKIHIWVTNGCNNYIGVTNVSRNLHWGYKWVWQFTLGIQMGIKVTFRLQMGPINLDPKRVSMKDTRHTRSCRFCQRKELRILIQRKGGELHTK
jgi:hypothetical protein